MCLFVCLSAFSDKTTEPILTNDGSVQPLGPWSGRNGPGFLICNPEGGCKGRSRVQNAFSDKTTEPIWTNDGSMKLLGPGRCHGHIEILKIRPETGEKSPRR